MAATTAAVAALLMGKAAMRPTALAARKAATATTSRNAWQAPVLLAGRRAFSQDAAAQAPGRKADRTLSWRYGQ